MKRIVFIEDDPMLRPALSARLRDAGYSVFEAAHGAEAIEYVRKHPVDLVITDMLMPEMDGVDTIRALRHYHPAVKIVAMSGGGSFSGENYLKIAHALGVHRTLKKPFTVVELVKAVMELIGDPAAPSKEKPKAAILPQVY